MEENKIKKIALSYTICLLLAYSGVSQSKIKKYLLLGSGQFVSGMFDGTVESINYHYENGFKLALPKANDQFWNPAVSWKNKYREGNSELGPKFTGSTTVFVWTTDAYHLLRTGRHIIDGFSLAYYFNKECIAIKNENIETSTIDTKKIKRKRWKHIFLDFVILTAIRSSGFHLTYSVLFKKQ